MTYLSDGLCHNQRLAILDLRGNRVTCDGVSGICQALVQKYNGNMKEVDLSRNRIGDEGALRIAKMLTVNKSLQKLKLNRNQISDAGGKELAEAMKVNKNLEVLDLANNFLQLSFLEKLNVLCTKNVKTRKITDIPSVRRKLDAFRNIRKELKDLST
jgi:Ran GTPase-activating protein (RanGAP) involved in mRNA processing and transport